MMEYLAVLYDSMAEFNKSHADQTSSGWKMRDFRICESPTHTLGLMVMWERDEYDSHKPWKMGETHVALGGGGNKVQLRTDGEWPV